METNRELCFVIMPFSKTSEEHTEEYWTRHFNTFLKPQIETNPDLEAHRSQALRGDILRQIITSLVVCRVVVADLTDHNPNVFWELGVRQSFKHGTITIAEVDTKLPFDIGGKGTLFYYPRDHLKMEGFRKSFGEAIKDCLKNPDNPDSHVLETLSGRGTLFEIFRKDEALRRIDALLSECNYNLNHIDYVLGLAQKNYGDPENRSFPTNRCRTSAIELLITNRYIDEDSKFFKKAERCMDILIQLNEQLTLWESSPESVEEWLVTAELEGGLIHSKRLKEFKTSIEAAHEVISKRF